MGNKIIIKTGTIEAIAELNDTDTARAIRDSLPITGQVNRWGDEIYFGIPLSLEPENGKDVVNIGDLAYWPPGAAFCIFFGATPISSGGRIKPASAVNVFGRVTGDTSVFRAVQSGAEIIIEKQGGSIT